MMTNHSGKFVMAVSHAATDEQQGNNVVDDKFTPPVPAAPAPEEASGGATMDRIKSLFGKLWWLWLVVIFFYITKEN